MAAPTFLGLSGAERVAMIRRTKKTTRIIFIYGLIIFAILQNLIIRPDPFNHPELFFITLMFSEFKEPKTLKHKLSWALIILAIILIFIIIYNILAFILYYWPLTLLAMTFIVYSLLRTFGTILMFPGYFNYYKGSIENNYSKQAHRKLFNAFKNLEETHNYLVAGLFVNDDRDSMRVSDVNLLFFMKIFQRFRDSNSLSKSKTMLLEKMEQITEVYNKEEDGKDSIKRFMYRRHVLTCQKKPSTEISLKLQQLAKETIVILETFLPHQGNLFQNYWRQSYNEKLYEIRFSIGMYQEQFHYEEHFIHKKTSLIIIKGYKDHDPNISKKIVLFCNPNGAFIQNFPFETSIVRFYVELGFNVALWNYRGYSKSVGEPSLTNNKEDVLLVYDFLKEGGYQIEIAHGYSIGGPISIYLASQRKVELLITDRTFASLQEVAKKFGKIAVFLLKLVFYKQKMDYSELYLNLTCRKLMIYDPYDDNIDNISSLKTGVARLVMSAISKQSQETQIFTQASQQNSGLYLNAKAALRKILPEKPEEKRNHFPSDRFSKQLIFNSLPFLIDKRRKNTSKNSVTSRRYFENSVEVAVENIHTDLLKYQLVELKTDLPKTAQMASKQALDQIGNIGYVDSTQMNIPTMYLNRFKYIVSNSDPIEEMKSYIQGLIVFGSYPLYRQNFQNPADVRAQTILKLHDLCSQLKTAEEHIRECHELEANLLQSLRLQFCKIVLTIYSSLQHPIFEKIGMILPVDCGHNGELRQFQYKILEEIIFERYKSSTASTNDSSSNDRKESL